MGTPASVVSEPPLWQVPNEARSRKQASANIFQDAELLQIQGLFQRSGDQLAEERAQIIWECAGDHHVAEALRRLRRKRPPRQRPLVPSLHHCSRLRLLSGLHFSTAFSGAHQPEQVISSGMENPRALLSTCQSTEQCYRDNLQRATAELQEDKCQDQAELEKA
ncbi:Arginine vasopressin-induced protein 1 [Heterocephalus glaber]|uniref:Arginine vasopressin-induced protein 1 n=1 Tax=Heterocephalus glaber TaxID=10181 RepID=G5C0B6_HETGA|nr:arginine vasopressin-induced protein 1 isoform X1 [Heterocephalus glaber]EHB14969.1 Arginine vasopressin-induced protein 1 [Heterocephalus glaber]